MSKWIWVKGGSPSENVIGCFRTTFMVANFSKTILNISADTRYVVYINGVEVGQGPIRSTIDRWFYDEYDITHYLDQATNTMAIKVWDYGMSTYQSIDNKGGLTFDVIQEEKVIASSDDSVKATFDSGIKSKTVKRNVNLGFMEHFDARKFDHSWIKKEFDDSLWEPAEMIVDNWGTLTKRSVKFLDHQVHRPENIYSIKEVKVNIKSVSVNLRENLFPSRKDANASIFSGFFGFYIDSPVKQTGSINFPNNKWNGVYGDFKIDNKQYTVNIENRKTTITLEKGRQLLLMNLNAKHDDLYAHMEFAFDKDLSLTSFFTIGPTKYIENKVDGFVKIYGGLENFEQMDEINDLHRNIYNSSPDLSIYKNDIKAISEENIYYDEYILSLVENKNIIKERPIMVSNNGLLHGNTIPTIIKKSVSGNDIEMVVDFFDMYVGNISFKLEADEGTVVDLYGFENLFEDDIDYTFGLNNSVRYIAKQGYQQYTTNTRMGFRYLMLTFRNVTSDIKIHELYVNQKSHPVSRAGHFRCNDYLLNKIHEISRRTHLLCCEDTFADSPTYEQAFWAGDAQVSSLVNAFYFGESELVKNCIKQVPLSRKYSKLISALMPTDWETSIPLWTMNWIITIDEYVFNNGDESVIGELYQDVKTTLDYYTNFIEDDGAFNISAWNMIDWAPMDIYNKGVMTAQQGILAHCFRILQKFGRILNKDNMEQYDVYINKLLSYIDQKLWIEDKCEFVDGYTDDLGLSKTVGMQTHIMLYKYDLIIDEDKKEIIRKKLFNKPTHWLDVGSPFILFYLFEIWHSEQKDQDILSEIRNRWGMMLRYDSSTCWEVFPGFYENSRTRSYCHSWSSAPGYVFIKYILGITPIEKGYKKVALHIPDVDLLWCEGSIPTPHGRIDVRWSKENNKKVFNAKVPKGIEIEEYNNESWKISIERI